MERGSIRGLRQILAGVSDSSCNIPAGVTDPGYSIPAGGSDPGYSSRRAKLFLPACTLAFERLLDALDHNLANGGRIAKADFAFRRMHIYVNARRIDLKKEKSDRILSFHEGSVITLAQRPIQQWVLHGTPVHESELLVARLPAHACSSDKSAQANF